MFRRHFPSSRNRDSKRTMLKNPHSNYSRSRARNGSILDFFDVSRMTTPLCDLPSVHAARGALALWKKTNK